jgi:hypothetical protein
MTIAFLHLSRHFKKGMMIRGKVQKLGAIKKSYESLKDK